MHARTYAERAVECADVILFNRVPKLWGIPSSLLQGAGKCGKQSLGV